MLEKKISAALRKLRELFSRMPPADLPGDGDVGVRVPRPRGGPNLSSAAAENEPDEEQFVLAKPPRT